jgi:hypothetical protein
VILGTNYGIIEKDNANHPVGKAFPYNFDL